MNDTNSLDWVCVSTLLAMRFGPVTPLLLCLSVCAADTIRIGSGNPSEWEGTAKPVRAEYTPLCSQARPTLRFETPGTASMPVQLQLVGLDKIAMRLVANARCRPSLGFRSGEGHFRIDFAVGPGEQVVLLPLAVFNREGAVTGWESVEGLSFHLPGEPAGAVLDLLSIEALPKEVSLTGEELFLYRPPIPRVNPLGAAWPLYAILSETEYEKLDFESTQNFQKNLSELYGVLLPFNPKEVTVKKGLTNVVLLGREVVLKAAALSEKELDEQGYEGFVVRAEDGVLAIAGQTRHGTAYGMYRFLERQGCRFYSNTCKKIPRKQERLLLTYEAADRPFFSGLRFRAPYWLYGQAGAARGAPAHAETPEDFERLFDKKLSWGWTEHTAGYLVPKQLYYDEHPDYYGQRGDGRQMPKDTEDFRVILCTTHPDVLRISAERTLRWIELQKDRKFFNLTQGDDHTWCRCSRCLAMDYEPENHSDRLLYWVNHVAREVAKKYPDKMLVTYAYGPTTRPPVKLKPEKNVLVCYCAWPNQSSCPCGIRDFDAPENVVAREEILGWLKVAPGQITLYDYNGGGRYTLYGMAWKVKWSARNGLSGFHYCGGNKSFEPLFQFVHSRLNWDPLLEVNSLKNEFINAFYGEAAPQVRELFDRIYDRVDQGDYDAAMNAGGFPPGRFFSREFVDRAFALFDQALELAKNNEAARSDLVQTKKLFIDNCFRLSPGRSANLTDEDYYVFARNLREYVEWYLPVTHQEGVEDARKRKKESPAFSYRPLVEKVWNLAFVRVEMGEDEGKLPPRVAEMLKDPREVVQKHRKTYFVEEREGGWRIPAIQFTGGQYWPSYRWKCEPRDAAIVRGTMTEVSRMQAELVLEKDPSDRPGILEMEGQDNDKSWCAPAPIQVLVNGRKIFDGPNDFVKQGWSRRSWPLPGGLLKKGQNIIEVRNLYSSDSLSTHWFMLSEVVVKFPEER